MLEYPISDREVQMKIVMHYRLPRFRGVKAKMNVSVPSDV